MRSVRAIHAVGGVAIAVAASLTACAPAAVTSPASQDVVATATLAPTDSAGAAATPPAAVPDGFPVFPGSESVPPADPGLVARWIAEAEGAEVYDFYVQALPAAGFAIEQRFPGGAAAVIRFSVPDGLQLDVSLTTSGSGTQVDLRLPDPAP
jgi:hypothetical protein